MAVSPLIPGNMKTNKRANIVAGTSSVQVVINTSPEHPMAVHVGSNALSTKKVELTSDALNDDGDKLDLTDGGILWAEVSASGLGTYFSGDQMLITGVRITSLNAVSAIQYSVTQVKG